VTTGDTLATAGWDDVKNTLAPVAETIDEKSAFNPTAPPPITGVNCHRNAAIPTEPG
jgi:hypothetical protein